MAAHYGVLTTNLLSTITGLDKSITGSSDRAIVLGDVPNITYVFQQYLNRSTSYQYAQFVGTPSIQQETAYSCITVNNLALYLSDIAWYADDFVPTTFGTGNESDPIGMTDGVKDNSFTLIYAAEQRITGQPSGFSTPKSAKLTVGSSTYTGIITKSSSTYYSGINSTYSGNMYLIKFSGLAETYSQNVTGYVDITNSFNAPVSTIWIERVYVKYYTYTPIYSDYTFNVCIVQPVKSHNIPTIHIPSEYSTPRGEFDISYVRLTIPLSINPDGSGERWSTSISATPSSTYDSYTIHTTQQGYANAAFITNGSNINPGYIGPVSFQIYNAPGSTVTYTADNVRVGTQFLARSTSSSSNYLYGMIWIEQQGPDVPSVGASRVVVYDTNATSPAKIYITLSNSSIA